MQTSWGLAADQKAIVPFKGHRVGGTKALEVRLALETDTILFDMRAAHDSVMALAVNQQIVSEVRSKIMGELSGKLVAALQKNGFMVYRKVTGGAAEADNTVRVKRVHSEMDADDPGDVMVPAFGEAALLRTVYPPASQETVQDLIQSIPNRSRGYQLSGAVRSYLSGYRETDDSESKTTPSRPWESAGDFLISDSAIVDDALHVAHVAVTALRYAKQKSKYAAKLMYQGVRFGWELAGFTSESHTHTFKSAYNNAPVAKFAFDFPTQTFTITVETLTFEYNLTKQKMFQKLGGSRYREILDSTFTVEQVPVSHLHNNNMFAVPATLVGIELKDDEEYIPLWTVNGMVQTCGAKCWGHDKQKNEACVRECRVPELARLAQNGDAAASVQLRDLLAEFPLKNASRQLKRIRPILCKKLESGYRLSAFHGAIPEMSDPPVVRIGGPWWFTGQHTLGASTGIMLAREMVLSRAGL